MASEFRVFEVDKYGNKFYLGRHSTLESAKYFLKKESVSADEEMGCSFVIEDESGVQHV